MKLRKISFTKSLKKMLTFETHEHGHEAETNCIENKL
jgi:hypothetical protein